MAFSTENDGGTARRFRRTGEIAVAALAVAVVVVLVVPIPQALLDLLIAVNLGLSMTLFAAALFVTKPLDLASFPTLLLVATLYRLALNVSSVRLILRDADAGRIIGAFGSFAVGGDILIGAVVFSILAIVLFLVITKGAERVAEVAARFSLDSLPGMQLAIETDLKSGAISPRELAKRRAVLARTSHYYGALDGAMKFVRGDAVANLAIIAVNLVGGAAVGMVRHGMSLGDALDTYGRLSIGDGLVTLLPAVLVSTAAGLLVTRLGAGEEGGRLGEAVAGELAKEPRALFVAAAAMLALAALPGFPLWPFAAVGAALAAPGAALLLGTRARRAARRAKGALDGEEGTQPADDLDSTQDLVDALAAEKPVLVRETVPRLVSLPTLAESLRLLREDGLDERCLAELLETVARGGAGTPYELAERARRRMPRAIAAGLLGPDGGIEAAVLDRDLEAVLENALARTADGDRIALPADDLGIAVEACRTALSRMERPALLVAPRLRRPLSRVLRSCRVPGTVVAHGELDGGVPVRVAHRVSA